MTTAKSPRPHRMFGYFSDAERAAVLAAAAQEHLSVAAFLRRYALMRTGIPLISNETIPLLRPFGPKEFKDGR